MNPNEPSRDAVSILGPTLRFKGELHAEEDLMIRGHVEGSITHSQKLTICREGNVRADIEGQTISVEGTVEGDLVATTSVTVTQTGRLTGDVRAPSVSIVEGANFNGSVVMATSSAARTQQSDGRSAAAGAAK